MYQNTSIKKPNHMSKRIIASILLLVVSFTISPTLVHALLPVFDSTDLPLDVKNAIEGTVGTAEQVDEGIRDTFLRALAYSVANALMQKVLTKTINWANTGFEGNPFYVQNAEQTFTNIALQNATFIADAFKKNLNVGYNRQVLLSLADKYSGPFSNPARAVDYTLPEILGSKEQADAFNNGDIFSWDAYKVLNEAGNNPYTAALNARTLIDSQIMKSQEKVKEELRTGGGFLSDKVCVEEKTLSDGTTICNQYVTNTPGAVVGDKIRDAVKSDNEQVKAAINNSVGILSAATTQLTSAVLDLGLAQIGKIGSGGTDTTEVIDYQNNWNTVVAVESNDPSVGTGLLGNPNEVSIRTLLYGTWRYGPNSLSNSPLGQTQNTAGPLTQGTIIADNEVTTKTKEEYLSANVYDISRMGMIDRTQVVAYQLLQERELLYSFRNSIVTLDQVCLFGPDRGYRERFDTLFDREVSPFIRRAANGNESAEKKIQAYEFLRSVMYKNIRDSMGTDVLSSRMMVAVNKIDDYNDRIYEVERLLSKYQSAQNDLRRLEAEFLSGASDKNEIARILLSKENSGQIPTAEVIFDQKNFIQTALGEKTYLEEEKTFCDQEIKKTDYQLRRYADKKQLLYCPLEGLGVTAVGSDAQISPELSAFFRNIKAGKVEEVNATSVTYGAGFTAPTYTTAAPGDFDATVLLGSDIALFGVKWFGGCIYTEPGDFGKCLEEASAGRAIDFHGGIRDSDLSNTWEYQYLNSKGNRNTERIGFSFVQYHYKYVNPSGNDEFYDEKLKIRCSSFYRSSPRDYESIYDRIL